MVTMHSIPNSALAALQSIEHPVQRIIDNMIGGITLLSITHWCVSTHIVLQYLKSCASLCPSHRYQFVWELVNVDLRLTMHDIISGTRCPRDAPASRQYSDFFVAFLGIFFAIRFLLHDRDVLDK